mmetsp:Transcript_19226/g.28379  ORF Transcript_19226/g.28379 Transcript_19226/m.28379 type:complete len:225 (-) Transcript_19226:406-1080(-)
MKDVVRVHSSDRNCRAGQKIDFDVFLGLPRWFYQNPFAAEQVVHDEEGVAAAGGSARGIQNQSENAFNLLFDVFARTLAKYFPQFRFELENQFVRPNFHSTENKSLSLYIFHRLLQFRVRSEYLALLLGQLNFNVRQKVFEGLENFQKVIRTVINLFLELSPQFLVQAAEKFIVLNRNDEAFLVFPEPAAKAQEKWAQDNGGVLVGRQPYPPPGTIVFDNFIFH